MYLQNIWLWVFLALHILFKYCSVYIYLYTQICWFSFVSWVRFLLLSVLLGLVAFLKPELCFSSVLPLPLSLSLYVFSYFLTLFFFHTFFAPLLFLLGFCSTFLWFLSFFCVLSLASSLDRSFSFSSSYSLLVLTSYLPPPPPRCSFRIAFSLVFCDFLQCNCC